MLMAIEVSEDSDAYWSASSAVYTTAGSCVVIHPLQSSRCSRACIQTILRGWHYNNCLQIGRRFSTLLHAALNADCRTVAGVFPAKPCHSDVTYMSPTRLYDRGSHRVRYDFVVAICLNDLRANSFPLRATDCTDRLCPLHV